MKTNLTIVIIVMAIVLSLGFTSSFADGIALKAPENVISASEATSGTISQTTTDLFTEGFDWSKLAMGASVHYLIDEDEFITTLDFGILNWWKKDATSGEWVKWASVQYNTNLVRYHGVSGNMKLTYVSDLIKKGIGDKEKDNSFIEIPLLSTFASNFIDIDAGLGIFRDTEENDWDYSAKLALIGTTFSTAGVEK